MPPKRDSIASGNNVSGNTNTINNETPTTSITNSSLASAQTSQINTANSSTITLNTTAATTTTAAAAAVTATAVSNHTLPLLLPDAAAEQRTIAYQANAKLCRLVRKCPWMYDRNHHNYAKKHILDKSWCKIARECNDSVASCKERWRNIRAAFARSINIYKTHSGPNRVKPYYLHKELSFLVRPMMEGRDKKDDYDDSTEGGIKDEDANAEEEDNEEEDDDEEEQAEGDESDFPDITADIKSAFEALNPDIRIQAETHYQRMLRNNSNNNNNNNNNNNESCNIFEPHTQFTTSDAENEFNFPDDTITQNEAERRESNVNNRNTFKRPMQLETETFENKKIKLSQNSQGSASENDIKFLEALLPDMALMNTRQKIVFKRKIYQTLEEVFENSNDFPNIEQTKMEKNNTNNNLGYNANSSGLVSPQVKQTILTVNSSTARNLINNIANLNEAELQRVNGFLQNSIRTYTTSNRLTNGTNTPSSAAVKLMSSTPKITITKVPCPPPAALRALNLNKPPSPSPNMVSTTIHHTASSVGGIIASSSNVHSTTSSNPGNASNIQNSGGTNVNHQNSPWNQVIPITIKDEIEDVDIV